MKKKILSDGNGMVVANTVAALSEIQAARGEKLIEMT
jgi:hypothetical protein